MYSSLGSTWAFLDGGVHYIDSDGYGMTTLHTGWRVLGWQVMRVLCELFDLAPPRRLKGEAELGEPADLIRQLGATTPGDPVLQERAELLASASTGAEMREIAARVLGGDAGSMSECPIGRPRLVEVRRVTWGGSLGYLADINFIFRVFVDSDGHEELIHDGADLSELVLAEVVGIDEMPELCLGSIRRWIRHLGGVEAG